jgi:hypothetical protein
LEKLTQSNLFIHLPLPRFLITKIAFGVADLLDEKLCIFLLFSEIKCGAGWVGARDIWLQKEHLLIFLARFVSRACFMLRCCYDSKIRLAI